jgi:hypothetical protein
MDEDGDMDNEEEDGEDNNGVDKVDNGGEIWRMVRGVCGEFGCGSGDKFLDNKEKCDMWQLGIFLFLFSNDG